MSRLTAAARTGAWLGVAAAGAAVGFATERYVMGRSLRGDDEYADEPFGTLRGRSLVVTTDDGVALHAEIDDARSTTTMIFTHGYALTHDAWHFQRRDLRGRVRMAFWDLRSHGRSEHAAAESISLERLADDLADVMAATASKGRIVLVGHSMGGMIVMALAGRRPELFDERVAGVALIGTSARGIDRVTLGLPAPLGRVARRIAPGVVAALARRSDLTERGRRVGGDIGYVLTRRYSFAGAGSPALVEFTAAMNNSTPIDVVADFLPVLNDIDVDGAFPVLARVPTLVIGADADLLTPVAHARDLAERIDAAGPERADYVEAENTGHMVMLERHELVTDALLDLLARAEAAKPRRTRLPRARTTRGKK